MASIQKSFMFGEQHAARREHGGEIRTGKRKLARPMDPGKPLHVVLRSAQLHGKYSLSPHSRKIHALIIRHAPRFQVRVRGIAIVGNHIHFAFRFSCKKSFQNFMAAISGLIARIVTSAVRGKSFGKFWESTYYSRVVQWGRDLQNVLDYLLLNELEAAQVVFHWERAHRTSRVVRRGSG